MSEPTHHHQQLGDLPEAASQQPYENVWQYLRDVAIGFTLMVGGMALGGYLAEFFQSWKDVAYMPCLGIGIVPFWWFTRHCGLHKTRFRDLAFGITILSATYSVLMKLIPVEKHPNLLLILLIGQHFVFDAIRKLIRKRKGTRE
ncbi:MAG: hypothetical protein JNL58_29445 [Planctomyces sp.]|nr:hypothetical protein [Planctomyces sp.]